MSLRSFAWKRAVLDELALSSAPRVLSGKEFTRIVGEVLGPDAPSGQGSLDRAARRFFAELVATGDVVRIQNGIYLNRQAVPDVRPEEAAGVLRENAVVTLHSVLGEAGVLNNVSKVVFAVVPIMTDAKPGFAREVDNGELSRFRFFTVREADYLVGRGSDRLVEGGRYARATPERALADWFLLSRKGQLTDPPLEADISDLRADVLARCMADVGAERQFEAWLERKREHDEDPGVSENSGVLGL